MTWTDLHRTLFPSVVIILFLYAEQCKSLKCYECQDVFKGIWEPKECQLNATEVPSRECNPDQQFCFVERRTVKGIVTRITRNCVNECFYGCEIKSFGITFLSCTSCCNTDNCNTGSHGVSYTLSNLGLRCVAVIPLVTVYFLWLHNRVT